VSVCMISGMISGMISVVQLRGLLVDVSAPLLFGQNSCSAKFLAFWDPGRDSL
jgi:hypothetical protein